MTYRHTSDLDDAFFVRIEEVADEVLARPRDILAVMMAESGVYAKARNPNGNASGILQMMPAILMGLGWSKGHEEFRELTATQQLEWVLRYFRGHRGHLVSVGAVYTAVFLPALLKRAVNPEFVLTARGGPLGWAYAPNSVLDANKDFSITVGELESAVARNCRGPRWAEIVTRLDSVGEEPPFSPGTADLGTTRGLQEALSRLGFDPGPIDGIPGVKTHAALVAFQKARGLRVDGIYGPLTRQAIAIGLATA